MGDPAKSHATYADVLATPRHLVASRSRLAQHPRPAAPHARATSRMRLPVGNGGSPTPCFLIRADAHLSR
jgi:hypothetical protein